MSGYGDLPYGYGEAPYGYGPYGGDILVPPYVKPPLFPPLPSFANAQDALDSLDTTTISAVYIGGVTVDAISWDARFGTGQVATATITVPLPRPDVVVANAAVECIGGHNDLVGTMFAGRIPKMEWSMSLRGNLLTIRPVGWASLLSYRSRFDLVFEGPITFNALFDALCARFGVPSYASDTAVSPAGVTLTLGGNPQINEGKVIIPANQSPLAFMNTNFAPHHYSVQDDPDGVVRLRRILGTPTDPVITITEGVHPFSTRHSYDITGMVNYPDVHGPTYEDAVGGSVPIRAFPATVESDSRIPVNDGVNYTEIRNSSLVTQAMADAALQAALIQHSEPAEPVSWEAIAVPGLAIGDAIEVDSGTIEVDGIFHLTGLTITSNGSGLTADYDGERGTGEMVAVGDNTVTTRVQTGVTHFGDEYLSHYAVPAPRTTPKVWDITIPERATAVAIRYYHHGTNSQVSGGVENTIEVSKFQIWAADVPASKYDATGQDAPRPETSGNLAPAPENLAQRKNYSTFVVDGDDNVTNSGNWVPGAVNLSRLDAADYKLRLVPGVKNGIDDFEIRRIDLVVYGTNEPVLIPQEVA
jgi:hypothetical protein